jgi:N6-adenosine-specific RNA methylase IME4
MTTLARYDAACAALAAAVKADEVMQVRIELKAIEAVARVAKNVELEAQAVSLRTRAEARLGDMLKEGEKLGIISGRGRQRKNKDSDSEYLPPATLKEIGVDPKLSARARKLSGIGAQAVDAMLARMEKESHERGRVAINVIDAELGRRNTESRRDLARGLSEASTALNPAGRQFPVVYADPAWSRKAGIGNRAYENHYGTMSWDDIIGMPVAQRVLPDAWLFLWIPRPHLLALHPVEIDTPIGRTTVKLPLAWAVAQGWGFNAYSTCSIWTKTDGENSEDHGLGLIFWDQDEILCLFKRGRGLPMPDGARKHGSNYRAKAGRHSEKPAYYRDMINDMTGGMPVLELFAREDDDHVLPPNFFTWGNQSKNTAEICDEPFDTTTGEILDPPAAGDLNPVSTPEPVQDTVSSAVSESGTGSLSLEDDGLDIPPFLRRTPPPAQSETSP